MLNLSEYKAHPDRLADHLPWAALVAPGVVLNKDGAFQATVRFRGPDTSSVTQQELMTLRARLNNVLRRYGSGWCLHTDAVRRPVVPPAPCRFPNEIAQQIEQQRCDRFALTAAYETVQHFTMTFLTPESRVRRATDLLFSRPDHPARAGRGSPSSHLEEFQRQVDQMVRLLGSFLPEVRPLDDAETLSYLHDCISTRTMNVRVPTTPFYLDELLSDAPIAGGLTPRLGNHFLKVLSVRAFVDESLPCLLDGLNALPVPFRWCVRYLPMDRDHAEAELKRIRRHWFARRKDVMTLLKEFVTKTETPLVDTDSLQKTDDITNALAELGSDCCTFGHLTLTVTTMHEDEDIAEQQAAMIRRVCDTTGLVTRVEDFNALEAWFGSLPGHGYANVRRPIVSSLNLCDLLPAGSIWSGPQRNDHLDAPVLAHVHTEGASPFRLSLHQGDVGHSMVVGPTGSGKSTLLNFLAMQWLRYPGAQVFVFDKGRSARAATLAMNGEFYNLAADGGNVCFQPLGGIGDEGEVNWAHEWLISILTREGIEMLPPLKQELWSALNNLATMPVGLRTITTLTSLIQHDPMRQALARYTLDGPFGHLLDADTDALGDAEWQTFEMEALMESDALAPVLTYLFHRLEQRFAQPFQMPDGSSRPRPTLLVLDEAWLFLDDTQFAGRIRAWLKTLRKKNTAVIFATQSLTDITESAIATAILESCPTRIYLPNPSAFERNTQELYRDFGLNQRQIAILQSAMPKRDYYYQSPSGNRLFQLELDDLALALCGAGSAERQVIIDELLKQSNGYSFGPDYLKRLGIDIQGLSNMEEQS